MRIRYYTSDGGDYFQRGGELLIAKRRLSKSQSDFSREVKTRLEASSFSYDPIDMEILLCDKSKVRKTKVNFILTESRYGLGQQDYLVHLNWWNLQLLHWMFKRHWLQQPRNSIQLIIIFIIIAIAGWGISVMESLS
jgi:hypothetical protein